MSVEFQVMSPIGEYTAKRLPIASRLPDLNGKTVCEVTNDGFRGDVVLPLIRELLKKRYPDIKVVPYTELPRFRPSENIDELSKSLQEQLLQKGCDAVIAGVGG